MEAEQGRRGDTVAGAKRSVGETDGIDQPARKAAKTAGPPDVFFNNSFSTPQQGMSGKTVALQQAARQSGWISPAFSRQSTPSGSIAGPSTSKQQGTISTPRPLIPASQLARNLGLRPSIPTPTNGSRRSGPPAFALPAKQTKQDERIHHTLSHVKPPLPPSTLKRPRSPLTAQFGVAGSQQKPPWMPKFGVKREVLSDEIKIDELERGLLPSPEKKNRHIKGSLAAQAENVIGRQATSDKLWSISKETSSHVPHVKMQIVSVLSILPGRILTRCRLVKGDLTFDAEGATEGIVLFSVGNKELTEGMTIGIWRPWNEWSTPPLKSPIPELSTFVKEEPASPSMSKDVHLAVETEEPPLVHSDTVDEMEVDEIPNSFPDEVPNSLPDEIQESIPIEEEPPSAKEVIKLLEQASHPPPPICPRALLVTRYRILG